MYWPYQITIWWCTSQYSCKKVESLEGMQLHTRARETLSGIRRPAWLTGSLANCKAVGGTQASSQDSDRRTPHHSAGYFNCWPEGSHSKCRKTAPVHWRSDYLQYPSWKLGRHGQRQGSDRVAAPGTGAQDSLALHHQRRAVPPLDWQMPVPARIPCVRSYLNQGSRYHHSRPLTTSGPASSDEQEWLCKMELLTIPIKVGTKEPPTPTMKGDPHGVVSLRVIWGADLWGHLCWGTPAYLTPRQG